MKKTTLILALALTIQNLNAHPGHTNHYHDSLLSEWGWLIIPAIIVFTLIYKFNKVKNKAKV